MLTEQYTPDAVCRAMGLPGFVPEGLPVPALRLLLKPSFDPEVCITLNGPAASARLSVIVLLESLWSQGAPRRISGWRESVSISASALAESLTEFAAALAADRQREGRMVTFCDGMPVDACLITDAGIDVLACQPYRPAVSSFVSRLLRLAWESSQGAGARNGLAACARYVGATYPRDPQPSATEVRRIVVLGTAEDQAELLQQLGEHGEPV
jgi:hypothetical protein